MTLSEQEREIVFACQRPNGMAIGDMQAADYRKLWRCVQRLVKSHLIVRCKFSFKNVRYFATQASADRAMAAHASAGVTKKFGQSTLLIPKDATTIYPTDSGGRPAWTTTVYPTGETRRPMPARPSYGPNETRIGSLL
jgi:hypothetical protein